MKSVISNLIFDHARKGSEYDWLALDGSGHLGLFSTAGAGPIPLALYGRESHKLEVFEGLYALPKVSRAVICGKYNHDIGDWVAMAERGIYAFDWRREQDDFCLVACPEDSLKCIGLEMTPDDFRSYVVQLLIQFEAERC
jgi:hypothetical protein